MMGWYYSSGGAGWMWLAGTVTMLLFWGGFLALVVWAVRSFTRPAAGGDSADEVLRRRLASGEISPEEYERTRRILHG